MVELTKDIRNVTRDGDKIILAIDQEQIFSRSNLKKMIASWKEALNKTNQQLTNFDKVHADGIKFVKDNFIRKKLEFEKLLKMTKEEHLREIEKIREEDISNAKAFIDKFDELLKQSVVDAEKTYENLHHKLQENKKEIEDTLVFWDKKEYTE